MEGVDLSFAPLMGGAVIAFEGLRWRLLRRRRRRVYRRRVRAVWDR